MAKASVSKASRQNRLRQIIAGIDKHFSNVTTITLGGVDRTPAQLAALIQTDIDASNVSSQTRQKLRADVQVERNSHTAIDPILHLFKAYVVAKFGDTNDASTMLGDFGYAPRKSSKKTVATKTEALGKIAATRGARHTMGPKQKAKIKGTAPAPTANGSTPNAGGATGVNSASKPDKPTS